MILQTERLRLRHFTLDDLDLIVEINNHPDCIRFNRWDSMSVEDCKAGLEKWMAQYDALPGCGAFCVESIDGEKIGMAFVMPQVEGDYEIGFRLRRDCWGKGYATEISRGFLVYAKEQLHASAVVAEVYAANTRSRRVFEKLNFACQSNSPDGLGLEFRYKL